MREYIEEGYTVAVDIDLSKFFDRVNHDILMDRVGRRVKDKELLRLIARYLKSGVEINGKVHPTREGVPQGGPLSPLLANILLDDLDKELEKRGHRFARYADDFLIMVRSQRAADRVIESVKRFLSRTLHLKVNEDKSQTGPPDQISFLGFKYHGRKIVWTAESQRKFMAMLCRLTSRSWGVSMSYRLSRIRAYVRGWMNYYRLSELYSPIPELDQWLRRRVRMCCLKQWWRPRICRTCRTCYVLK